MTAINNYYQQLAFEQQAYELAVMADLRDEAEHLQEMKDEARYWARVDAAEFERENYN